MSCILRYWKAIKNMKLLNIGGFINKIELKGVESNADW